MVKCFLSMMCAVSLLVLCSCAPETILGIDDYYSQGRAFEEKGDIKNARKAYENLLKYYPRSPYTKEVMLKTAQFKYQQEDYVEALADFLIYQKYYESYDESEYIQYMTANCYFYARLPHDRDQTFMNNALSGFQALIYNYPDSGYLPDAIEKIRIINGEKARAEMDVAVQYYKIRAYTASRERLLYLLENYPGHGFEEEAYYRLAMIFQRFDKQEDYEKYYNLLKESYPDSKYLGRMD